MKKNEIKSSENDQLTGHFQIFFFSAFFSVFFFYYLQKNSKTSKVNQQSVLNIYICHHFPNNLDRIITLTVSLSKIHRQNLKNILFFQPNK